MSRNLREAAQRLKDADPQAIREIALHDWDMIRDVASGYLGTTSPIGSPAAKAVSIGVRRVPVPVREIIHALEREAGNTDTDPRWLAATKLRDMQNWEARTLICECDVDPEPVVSHPRRKDRG